MRFNCTMRAGVCKPTRVTRPDVSNSSRRREMLKHVWRLGLVINGSISSDWPQTQTRSSTSVYFLSTWTCCAQPQDSSRKWRQGGDGGSQFHSGFPLDYKPNLTEPARLLWTFVKLSPFGRRTQWSHVEAVLDNERPQRFFGVFLS